MKNMLRSKSNISVQLFRCLRMETLFLPICLWTFIQRNEKNNMIYLKTIFNNACTFRCMDFYEKLESLKLTNNIVYSSKLRQWLPRSVTFTSLLLNVTSHAVWSKLRNIQVLQCLKDLPEFSKRKRRLIVCDNLPQMHCCSICGVHWQSQTNMAPFCTKILENNSRITTWIHVFVLFFVFWMTVALACQFGLNTTCWTRCVFQGTASHLLWWALGTHPVTLAHLTQLCWVTYSDWFILTM